MNDPSSVGTQTFESTGLALKIYNVKFVWGYNTNAQPIVRETECKLRGQIFIFLLIGISIAGTGAYQTALPMISINICLIELLTNACRNKQGLHALSLMNRIKITHVIHQIN